MTDPNGHAPAQVARHFVDHVDHIEPLGGGLINDTYRVDSGDDAFVLQRLNPEVFVDAQAVMSNIVAVTEHLDGRIVPRLRATRGGAWSVGEQGATWRAWELVTDAVVIDTPSLETVQSAARLVGEFHLRLRGFDPARLANPIEHFHEPAWHLGRFEEVVREDPVGRVGRAGPEIEAIRGHVDLAGVATRLIREHGPAAAHNDTKLANFLFRGDEAVCLLDLDTVMPTAPFWDVADLVRSAGHRAGEDDPDPIRHRADAVMVAAILDGYRQIRPAGDELEVGCVLIAYEQVLRFLTDWLRGDRYWKTTSPIQNLNRARGQLVLLESLRELLAL